MAKTEAPRLRHCTLVGTRENDKLHIVVGTDHFELSNVLGTREEFLNVKRYFDGRHSIEDIANITAIPRCDIEEVVATFDALGMLRSRDSTSVISTDEFIARINASVKMWSQQLGYHRLYGGLERREYRKEVFLGLFLETFHYVNSAARHISTATSHCTNEVWSVLLSEYLTEEYDHAKLIVETLVNLGVPASQVRSAHPLIGTLSLVNMLCQIGRESTLGYIACTALFEARKDSFSEAKETIERLATNYGFSKDAVAPILSHMEEDIAADHNSLIQEALEGIETISAKEADFVVNHMHDLKHAFDQFHDQIIEYYSDLSNYIPRLKVDFFSL